MSPAGLLAADVEGQPAAADGQLTTAELSDNSQVIFVVVLIQLKTKVYCLQVPT